jgi:hypothetical protein
MVVRRQVSSNRNFLDWEKELKMLL